MQPEMRPTSPGDPVSSASSVAVHQRQFTNGRVEMGSIRLAGLIGISAGVLGLSMLANQRTGTVSCIKHQIGAKPMPDAYTDHIDAARSLNQGAGLLACSVLSDSAMEHYRGSYANPAMVTPLASALLSLLASVHGNADKRASKHIARDAIYLTAAAAGLSGTAFHIYNVTKRPGGWSWDNLFHAAPVGAPMALLLCGALGALSERLRDEPAHEPRLLGLAAGSALALFIGAGLLGTAGEAALLHFRGAFQHKAMYAPIIIPPTAALLLANAALRPAEPKPIARLWMRITALLGFVGSGFHARGIARRQGGWRNWSQNLFAGPPLPAPPSFSALAIAGLAALKLRETEK